MRRNILIVVCSLVVIGIILAAFGQSQSASGRGRSVSSDILPEELKNLNIKDDFIQRAGKEVGVIQTVIGSVVVARDDMSGAYYANAGDKLFEKDVIFTLKDSRCRFKLNGEDVVTMAKETRVGIKSFSENRSILCVCSVIKVPQCRLRRRQRSWVSEGQSGVLRLSSLMGNLRPHCLSSWQTYRIWDFGIWLRQPRLNTRRTSTALRERSR
jgi:hypothetical protein